MAVVDDLTNQLAARDSLRRKLALRATPAERMRAMALLQQRAREVLLRSPEGYAHFMRRNMRDRAILVRNADAT